MSQGIIKSWARERVHKQEDSSTERSWHREKQDSSSISSSKSWPGKSIGPSFSL